MLWIRILGALEAEVEGALLPLGGPIPRRLLAALTLGAGGPMTDDELADLVWVDSPPDDVIGALRVAASRLRNGLGESCRGLLARNSLGYHLTVEPAQVDANTFAESVASGRAALAAGDAERAERVLRDGLELWRGRPWDDLGDGPSLLGPRTKLVELRDEAFEELQSARLARGDAPGAVAALSAAVIESPYRERRWELLALGLYRTGRQTQALAELRRVRELLDTELGVAPGPALRELEERILRHDTALAVQSPGGVVDMGLPRRVAPVRFTGLLSSFVGRVRESATLTQLVKTQRLVTLVGPAGVGKTRLAFEFASRYQRSAPDADVWVVRLADVHSATDVAGTVAAHMGVTHAFGDSVAHLERALAGRRGLLVLDNCEHVLGGVRDFVSRLLPGATALRVLATSRQLIGVDGEYLLDVTPLSVTDAAGGDGDAMTLLYQRVKSARPQWEPTPDERVAARALCSQLDGLPLAIELAASRVRSVGLAELTRHLADRLDVLGETSTGSVTPHATLQAAIGWSVDGLAGADRDMLLRLWPFEGGFTWQAAEFVDPHDGSAGSVLAVLASLVDRSVVMADSENGETRYRLLETIRRYCADLDPDPSKTRDAHAAWARRHVAAYAPLFSGMRAREACEALGAQLPNIRAAIAHDLDHRPHDALRTMAAVAWVWVSLGLVPEGVTLLRSVLEACPDASAEDRAAALIALSSNLFNAEEPELSAAAANEAIALLPISAASTTEWRLLAARARMQRIAPAVLLRDAAGAVEHMDGYRASIAGVTVPAWIESTGMLSQGLAEFLNGDHERGAKTLHRAGELGRDCGYAWTEGAAAILLARFGLSAGGDARQAAEAVVRAVAALEAQGNIGAQLSSLHCGVHCLFRLGRVRDAVRLRAAIFTHADRMGFDHLRLANLIGADNEALLSDALPEPDRALAEAEGRLMSFDEIAPAFRKLVDAL
jgi:predicted ATPase/DNA-binding SARP family transcriptional activator